MIAVESIGELNTIKVEDLNEINPVLFDAFHIDDINLGESITKDKLEWLNGFADVLKKIFFRDSTLSDDSKLVIIKLLDKINTQRDILEMIISKTSPEDLLIASERLSKKSQSAFG